jgi:hypothetical protein
LPCTRQTSASCVVPLSGHHGVLTARTPAHAVEDSVGNRDQVTTVFIEGVGCPCPTRSRRIVANLAFSSLGHATLALSTESLYSQDVPGPLDCDMSPLLVPRVSAPAMIPSAYWPARATATSRRSYFTTTWRVSWTSPRPRVPERGETQREGARCVGPRSGLLRPRPDF